MASVVNPMLATRLDDSRRLPDPRYIAVPKLGGQRRSSTCASIAPSTLLAAPAAS